MQEVGGVGGDAVLDALGIRVTPGTGRRLSTDEYLSAQGLGVTVMDEIPAGGSYETLRFVMRVTQEPGAAGQSLEVLADKVTAEYPGTRPRRTTTRIGGHPAVVLHGLPGAEGETRVTVVQGQGRLYRIVQHADDEGAQRRGADDAEGLEFHVPGRSVASLGLPAAEAMLRPAQSVRGEAPATAEKGKGVATSGPTAAPPEGDAPAAPGRLQGAGSGRATRGAAPGCLEWPRSRFLQTPWSTDANGDGFATAGPNHFGEGLHKSCDRSGAANEFYALDFGFNNAAKILPNAPGVVVYAGWAGGGWSTYGRMVIVDMGGGFHSLAAHLASVNVSAGQQVTDETVIGTAGGSGNLRDWLWGRHLHNSLHFGAKVSPLGGIYGGQSVQPRAVRFFRSPGGVYETIERGQRLSW